MFCSIVVTGGSQGCDHAPANTTASHTKREVETIEVFKKIKANLDAEYKADEVQSMAVS